MCGSLHTVLPGDGHASRVARTATDSTGAPDDVGLEAARELIRRELRKARRGRGLSQEQLGDAVDASRFTINRLETGQVDRHPDLAQRLDTALGTMLATLVAKRDQGPDTTSNAVASRLLHTPSLQRVRIVLADLLGLPRGDRQEQESSAKFSVDAGRLTCPSPTCGSTHRNLVIGTVFIYSPGDA